MMATASSNANPANSPRRVTTTTIKPVTAATVFSSPWTQIIRGESEPIAAASANSPTAAVAAMTEQTTAVAASPPGEDEGMENGNGGNNAGKRPAWNKPSNGQEVGLGPVMGAHSWPALSDAARASSNKSSSSDSLKGLADNPSPVSGSQGTGNVSSSPQRQVSNNANINSAPNHTIPSRQRSMKRNANSSFNGGISHPPGPQGSTAEGPINNPSPRDHTQRSGFVSQSHGGGDHPPQRPYRNRNGGQHPRGDGSHHHNYGGRRDQDRANQDWNHRNFNNRDAHLQPQRVLPRFMRHPPPPPPPPPSSTPFIAPPPVRPFAGPMGFPDMPSHVYYVAAPPPESLRGVPFIAPVPHALFLAPDLQLHSRIVNQIDYYFSNENLVKDIYLRQNMDDQGWVPVKLIAGFKKVLNLTDNIQLILDALRNSTVVEVQGDKVRKRHDWMRWIMPPSVQLPNVSAAQSQGNPNYDMLSARIQTISLDENPTDYNSARSPADGYAEASLSRSSSGDLNNQPPLPTGASMSQVSSQWIPNRLTTARSLN